ncbi:MAG: DNA alkylation repair protein [Bacteroidales bacterium]|nr:DNA alkylation repair protein [Bacteroidales bacterium]
MSKQTNFLDRDSVLHSLRKQLDEKTDLKTKDSGPKFFKEQVKLYGVKTAVVTKISKEYLKYLKDRNKNDVFSLCEDLWKSGYLEESFVACNWSYSLHKQYSPEDFFIFEKWLSLYVNNWASCDTLCNHTIGTLVEKYPELLEKLILWTQSENRWLRRGAAVTLIIPARHGKFLEEIFRIADALLEDKDDLVQKGYGWMLKAASEAHEPDVFDYVLKHKSRMPRTALRYAIEKMPADLKSRAMEK